MKLTKKKSRLWIEILNTSHSESFKIKKKTLLEFLVVKPEDLTFKYGNKKRPKKAKTLLKNCEQTWKLYWEKKKLPKRRFP